MNDKLIVLAGGTGDLGKRIALALINMYSGQAKLQNIDNNRYPELKWTSVKDFLKTIQTK